MRKDDLNYTPLTDWKANRGWKTWCHCATFPSKRTAYQDLLGTIQHLKIPSGNQTWRWKMSDDLPIKSSIKKGNSLAAMVDARSVFQTRN